MFPGSLAYVNLEMQGLHISIDEIWSILYIISIEETMGIGWQFLSKIKH